jgi:lauroyl/myristoyl acyltransferase
VSAAKILKRPANVAERPPLVSPGDVKKAAMLAGLAILAWTTPERSWDRIGRLLADLETLALRARKPSRFAGGPKDWRSNLETLTPDAAFWYLRAMVGRENLAVLRSFRPGGWKPSVAIVGFEHVAAALEAGRGAILWDSTFAGHNLVTKMALSRAGVPPVHLSHPSHGFSRSRVGGKFLNPVLTRVEDRYLAERLLVADADSWDATVVSAMRAFVQRLRANAVVTITAYGSDESRKLVELPCLSGTVRFPTGPANLAVLSGAPLLPVFTLHKGPGRFEVHIEPALPITREDRAQGFASAIESYVQTLEQYVKRDPELWIGWHGLALEQARA